MTEGNKPFINQDHAYSVYTIVVKAYIRISGVLYCVKLLPIKIAKAGKSRVIKCKKK